VNHGTYGNSAIHTDIAALQADIDGMATDADIADAYGMRRLADIQPAAVPGHAGFGR
jgi:hypothetical protein